MSSLNAWIVILTLFANSLCAQYSDEFLANRVAQIRDAQAENNFSAIAAGMHEEALAYYRRILSTEIENLRKEYADAAITGTTGIDLVRLPQLSDSEFFVYLCKSLIRTKTESAKPIIFLGVVREGAEYYHVVCRYREPVELDKENDVLVSRPFLTTLRQSGNDVRLWNLMLASPSVLELRKRLKDGKITTDATVDESVGLPQ